jgi:hypothetical protein
MARTVDHRRNFNGVERLPDDHPLHAEQRTPRVSGDISYTDSNGHSVVASLDMLLIREAWSRGCSYEDQADGFGPGEGTHGDWSAIRDSSDEAKSAMLERALNFLFPLVEPISERIARELPDLLSTATGVSALCGVFRQCGTSDRHATIADELLEMWKAATR